MTFGTSSKRQGSLATRFVPTAAGQAPSKDGMAKTWQTVAVWNHVPKHVADKITGHGARVAMAMFLAA